jgi:hypothetical protein
MSSHCIGLVTELAAIFGVTCLSNLSFAEGRDGEGLGQSTQVTQVVVLGTIHDGHFRSLWYSPEVLREIIVTLKPQAILNELPLNKVERDGRPASHFRAYDVSPECWAADEAAQRLQVQQFAFDRPDRDEHYIRTKYFERENEAARRLREWAGQLAEKSPEHPALKVAGLFTRFSTMQTDLNTNGMPETINSVAFDEAIRAKHNVWYDILPSMAEEWPDMKATAMEFRYFGEQWRERNQIMASNIGRAAAKYPAGRLVVLAGCEYRYILRDLLASRKQIELKEYWELVRIDPRSVPLSAEGRAHKARMQKKATQTAATIPGSQPTGKDQD